jgi:hypothetical protein
MTAVQKILAKNAQKAIESVTTAAVPEQKKNMYAIKLEIMESRRT